MAHKRCIGLLVSSGKVVISKNQSRAHTRGLVPKSARKRRSETAVLPYARRIMPRDSSWNILGVVDIEVVM